MDLTEHRTNLGTLCVCERPEGHPSLVRWPATFATDTLLALLAHPDAAVRCYADWSLRYQLGTTDTQRDVFRAQAYQNYLRQRLEALGLAGVTHSPKLNP